MHRALQRRIFWGWVCRGAAVFVGGFLALTATPALADSVKLSCRVNEGSGFQTFRLDYATKMIEQLGPDGAVVIAADAQISENTVRWSLDKPGSYQTADAVKHQGTVHFEGYLDRSSGTGYFIQNWVGVAPPTEMKIACQPAKQTF